MFYQVTVQPVLRGRSADVCQVELTSNRAQKTHTHRIRQRVTTWKAHLFTHVTAAMLAELENPSDSTAEEALMGE